MRRRAEAGGKDTAFNHLLYFIQYQRTGHIEQANEQIRKAEALCNEETDITIRSQILINRGVPICLVDTAGNAVATATTSNDKITALNLIDESTLSADNTYANVHVSSGVLVCPTISE